MNMKYYSFVYAYIILRVQILYLQKNNWEENEMKKPNKKSITSVFAGMLSLGLAACFSVPAFAYEGPEYSLQLGHAGAEDSLEDITSTRFAELVDEMSDGKISVEIFGNAQMGGLADLVDAIRYDTLDIAIFAVTDADSYYPAADVITLPYLFDSFDHVEKFYDSDIYGGMMDDFASQTNCRELSSFHAGFRCILSNKEINTASDMEGLTIRVPEIQSYLSTFGALGCNTVVLPASEVYQGLSTGLIEATEAAPSYMRTQNYFDQTDYFIESRHIYCGNSLMMSQSKLDGMDETAVEVLEEAAKQAAEESRDAAEEEDTKAVAVFEEAGLKHIVPDKESFQNAMADVWTELLANVDGGQELVDQILALK